VRNASRRGYRLINLLLIHPDIGIHTDDPVIRRLAVVPYPYLIFYEVSETEIIIHAVRHAVRNPSGMPGSA
jgi:plasmid stabilization system protein ParE